MTNFYDSMHIVPRDCWNIFFGNRKTGLNTLERFGLESVAAQFIWDYEESACGEVYSHNINDYLRICGDDGYVDILDGAYDTYEFDGYLIDRFWTTENGCLLLTVYKIPEDCEDWQEHDWIDEFEEVLIRLD